MASYVGGSWSSPESDLEAGAYCSVCLIDTNPKGAEKVKSKCHLPIRRKPSGPVYKGAIRNAMARLNQVKGASSEQKRSAARALVRHARAAGIEVTSEAVLRLAGQRKR